MIPFEFIEARSLHEAVGLLDPDDSSVRPFAGGTALMLMMKAGVFRPTRLVGLGKIETEHSQITADADGTIRIGALTRLAALESSALIRQRLPVIAETMRVLSNIRVRNVATVGGNLAHGDPHMDLPPVLIALGATVTVVGPAGTRTLPVSELVTGYYETQLAKNELIAEVTIPPQHGKRSVYLKCTTRAVHDWPTLGVAVSIDADRDTIRSATLIISASTERPARMESATALLVGNQPAEKLFREAGEAAAASADLVGDLRGSVAYKRQLVRVFVTRALHRALDASALQ